MLTSSRLMKPAVSVTQRARQRRGAGGELVEGAPGAGVGGVVVGGVALVVGVGGRTALLGLGHRRCNYPGGAVVCPPGPAIAPERLWQAGTPTRPPRSRRSP